MREIKFRGISTSSEWEGEMVYGHYNKNLMSDGSIGHFIYDIERNLELSVKPETVGQCTGLKDENGKEVYKGDQLYAPGNLTDDLQYIGYVVWDEDDARWEVVCFHGRFEYIPSGCVVQGHIYDNTELLGVGKE